MKASRLFLSLALLAALIGGSLPGFACVSSCGGMAPSLACVKACARGAAYLTEGGKLASVSSGICGIRTSTQKAAVLAADVAAPAPMALLSACVTESVSVPKSPLTGLWIARAPPSPHGFLSVEHPSAQAPPTLL